MPGTANSGGRNRKSERQHKLQGTFQKVRHAGTKTPEAPIGVPILPKPLDGDALAEWTRMISRLQRVGSLSDVDDAAIYQYALAFAECEELALSRIETAASIDIVEENLHGLKGAELVQAFQEITKLRQLESSYIGKIQAARSKIRQWLVEFGMTPSARTRVKLPDTKPVDPFAEFDEGPIQ